MRWLRMSSTSSASTELHAENMVASNAQRLGDAAAARSLVRSSMHSVREFVLFPL